MTEAQLYTLVIQALQTGLTAMGIALAPVAGGVSVKQRYQPLTQGTPSNPTIYVHFDDQQRYGYPGRSDIATSVAGSMLHSESQLYIPMCQVSATSIADTIDPDALAVGDLVKYAAFILNSDATRLWLRSNGLAVERIKQIRKTHFKDDKNRFEEAPTFDCSFVYCEVNTSLNPSIDKVTVTLYPLN